MMPDLSDTPRKHNRLSLHFGRSSSRDQQSSEKWTSGLSLTWSMESPPVLFHGDAEESTGALISGQVFIEVKDDAVELDGFKGSLRIHTTQKRPFEKHCPDCTHQYRDILDWVFLPRPTTLHKGKHAYPFSGLLSGDLPASMDSSLMSIAYELKAEAQLAKNPDPSIMPGLPLVLERILPVKRSIAEPENPHHSVRVFPPTNIKASAYFDPVIHPNGTHKVSFRLDGLMSHNERVRTVDLWRLRKITWKLEETVKTIAPACAKHRIQPSAQLSLPEDQMVGAPRSEVRVLGEKNILHGWKTDYTGSDGMVELEFDYLINNHKSHSRELKFACDSHARNGTQITHSLLVELVVSKDYAPEGKTHLSQPTGTGRILRMHYGVVLTDHSGLGVSWDNEAPPTYEDVPPSPPVYDKLEIQTDGPAEYENLEMLEARRSSVEPLDMTIRRTTD